MLGPAPRAQLRRAGYRRGIAGIASAARHRVVSAVAWHFSERNAMRFWDLQMRPSSLLCQDEGIARCEEFDVDLDRVWFPRQSLRN